jgi:RNA polymerase sigma-70 factor (sigma-E family)
MIGGTVDATSSTVTAAPRGRPYDDDFSEYVAARQPTLLRVAYLLTGSRAEAEDLLQTSFAKLYLAWGRIEDPANRDAYTRQILVREHASSWRRLWRRRETSVDEVGDAMAAHTGFVTPPDDSVTERAAMWRVVQSLPPRQRAVVVLRYYEDCSERQTAEVLGCSVGTVKSQCSRALASLRTQLSTTTVGGRP